MIRSVTVASVLCVALVACQTTTPIVQSGSGDLFSNELLAPTGLQAAANQRFPDVPLPVNTRQDMERTYVYESRTIQIGRMVYTIKEPVNDVAQFYIRECALQGWTMDSALQAGGVVLIFDRPGKRLVVSITPTGITKRKTQLVLNYAPSDDGAILDNSTLNTSPL